MARWKIAARIVLIVIVASYVLGMFMHREIRTEIIIDGSVDQVWQQLVDFDRYPEWNPFITKISGERAVDGMLETTISPPDGDPMDFEPRILAFDKNRELRWLGRVLIPGLFDGEHYFKVDDVGGGKVRFRHGEKFRGILAVLAWGAVEPDTTEGFELMNAALKARVEAKQPTAVLAQ